MATETQTPVQPTSESGQAATTATTSATAEAKQDTAPAGADTVKTDPKEQTAESKPSGEGEKPQETAPADVELTFPEGVKLDGELVDGVKGWAKQHGLKSDQAQGLADLFVKRLHSAEQEAAKAWEAQKAEWRKAIESDETFGGSKLEATKQAAAKAMDRLSPDGELRKVLDESGLGDHPALVRALARVGMLIREDSISGTAAAQKSGSLTTEQRLERLYGPPSK